MTSFLINGEPRPVPAAGVFGDLLEHVKATYVSDRAWITSVLLNGRELGDWDGPENHGIPAGEIESVEVRLDHPRSIAKETLETLQAFMSHLEKYALQAAQALRAGAGARDELDLLLDNLNTFTESLNGVKRILGGEACEETAIIEVDLLSILSDTLEFQRQGQSAYVAEMLETHLVSNFREWREEGLPALRDRAEGAASR
ncbi:MAG: hypothetical protein NDJ89_01995 [Oligoflexia bacterium]|nr:hypothetical protein [Oligoflexia bacterium]